MPAVEVVTVENVDRAIEYIDSVSRHSPELAHVAEDFLWESALESIANGYDQPERLARLALASRAIHFQRGVE